MAQRLLKLAQLNETLLCDACPLLRNLSVATFYALTPLESALPKNRDLKPFRMNTYKKKGGGGQIVN
jgi:hypothetical protein